MGVKNEAWIEYCTNKKAISFWGSGFVDEEERPFAMAFNDFLYGLSRGKKVFLSGYRFFEEDFAKVVDAGRILDRAEVLLNPFLVFLNVSGAKINTHHCDCACQIDVWYFDDKVEWVDFLATDKQHLWKMSQKALVAHFQADDHGAGFYFRCGRDQEESVLKLLRTLSDLGCKVKKVSRYFGDYGLPNVREV